ncbi:hypothetical protein BDW02DRAFT_81276 [Decorospora gaudefroyi]|uniref:Uncharacterized protein n=1 Tax=Decorospora gaudefroyi TaxID=184978 RepID=A0A6A5KPA4_9PLEO|nr:hypothetical protein BDW02DRAFT_81276 [Decorospora gaudefroyi]
MLHVELLHGREGLDKKLLPAEYFDKEFLRSCHPATELAMRKLWPNLWQFHVASETVWTEPTVPLLTGAGEIILDSEVLAQSDGRLEKFEEELKMLDEELEEKHRKLFDIDTELGDDEDDSDETTESDSRSNPPPSEKTGNSSPPPSKSTPSELETGEAKQRHPHESEHNDTKDQEEHDDGLPSFIKNLRARIRAQESVNEQLASYVSNEEIDQDVFLAQYGQSVYDDVLDQQESCEANQPNNLSPNVDDEKYDEPTIEQRAVDGEHDTCSKWEYEQLDDELKMRYHEAMVELLVDG